MEVTGTIKGWKPYRVNDRFYILYGYIFEDIRRRWADGQWIHTSMIDSKQFPIDKLSKGAVVNTLNSRYKLGAGHEEFLRMEGKA